jgi:HAD superfamily hydrolase (TIGR01509 family)
MVFRMIQAVIFDMDGLLIDTEPEWQRMERDFVRKLGIEITPELQKQTLGLRSIDLIKFWHNYKPWPDPDFEKTEREFDEGMRDYYIKNARLMSGVNEVLNFFKYRKMRMALASSSPRFLIDTFTQKFNLQNFFEVIHSAEYEEYGKPHPAVYISTARKLGIAPSLCLAFEDSFNGLLAAKSAMMKAVAVPEASHFHEERFSIADLKLRNLAEFGEKDLELLSRNQK